MIDTSQKPLLPSSLHIWIFAKMSKSHPDKKKPSATTSIYSCARTVFPTWNSICNSFWREETEFTCGEGGGGDQQPRDSQYGQHGGLWCWDYLVLWP